MSLITRLAAAAGLAVVLAAPAFAQTTTPTALNGQLNWGDVVADINVVTLDDARSAAAVATAAGNSVSGANVKGGLDAASEQTMSGATFAYATLSGGNVTHANAMSTAQANTLQAQTTNGALNMTAAQIADGGDALARSRVTIRNAKTLSAVSRVASNNAATAAEHGELNVALTQSASNSAYAITDDDACCTGHTAAGASAAINAWSSSSSTSTVNAQYKQTSTGAASEATTDVYQNRAYSVTAATTAAANSASIANEWGYAQIRGRQTSSTNVKVDTRVTLLDLSGTTSISAYGVGNSTLATNVGSDMVVDVAQLNTGGVDANAQFTGASFDHGDVVLASTAIGNGFTGSVCSQCGDAALSGAVSQTNGGNIISTGSITANGAGAIIGSASAIGNSASFITTQKGH
jgi:hypothetical protein